jgi:hypothetical protein
MQNHRISAHSQRWASVTMGKFETVVEMRCLKNWGTTIELHQKGNVSRCPVVLAFCLRMFVRAYVLMLLFERLSGPISLSLSMCLFCARLCVCLFLFLSVAVRLSFCVSVLQACTFVRLSLYVLSVCTSASVAFLDTSLFVCLYVCVSVRTFVVYLKKMRKLQNCDCRLSQRFGLKNCGIAVPVWYRK